MKIIITGSESFVGRELRRQALQNQIEVIGFDAIPNQTNGSLGVDIRSSDIAHVMPDDTTALIHLAAISRDQDCVKDPRTAFDVNVGGTLNLLRMAQQKKIRQFIFASSEWVCGEVKNDEIQTEDFLIDAGKLKGEYALTKLVGERLLAMAHERDGLSTTVLRFGIIYGPRPSNWSAVEMLFNAVKTQDVVEVKGSLQTARRFIHVSDIASGILRAIGRRGFEIFNLSGDQLIRLNDIIHESASLLNRNPQVVERNPSAISIRNLDNSKAKRILNWKPRLDLRAGLSTLQS